MYDKWYRIIRTLRNICCVAAMSLPVSLIRAANGNHLDLAKYHADIMELSVDQNISTPEIPRKSIAAVEAYQKEKALSLKKSGYTVELTRDRQVIVVTIPVSELFMAGKATLASSASGLLMPIANMAKTSDLYKVLIVAHSDDTGSETYLNTLTEARANAVADWLGEHKVNTESVVPYGLGKEEPYADNSSRAGREANRRLEIYLIPGPVMLDMARSKRL